MKRFWWGFVLFIGFVEPCALPYWWVQQFSLPPNSLQAVRPRKSISYRETFHSINPYNFFHIKEYTELTWYENNFSNITGSLPSEAKPDTKTSSLSPGAVENAVKTGIKTLDVERKIVKPDIKNLQVETSSTATVTTRKSSRRPKPTAIVENDSTTSATSTSRKPTRKPKTITEEKSTSTTLASDATTIKFTSKPEPIVEGISTSSTTVSEQTSTTRKSTRKPKVVAQEKSSTSTTTSEQTETTGKSMMVAEENPSSTSTAKTTTRRSRKPSVERNENESSVTEPTSSSTESTSTTTRRSSRTRRPKSLTITEETPNAETNEIEQNKSKMAENLMENKVDRTSRDSKSEEQKQSWFGGWLKFGSKNESEPCRVTETDINSLRSMVEKLFSSPRDHEQNPESKEAARENILKKFREYGLQVWTQNFTAGGSSSGESDESNDREGVNLIGVIPGKQRGAMSDGIVLLGAHYDTVANTNGVDDNGSGLAVMLEVARALTEARCRFNNTLMFVAFDLEEDGAMGSNHFVEHYLIPEELKRARAHFQGAFILDGIMNFNNDINTQDLPTDFAESLPGLQNFVNQTGNRGDFLALISRNHVDNHLTKSLMEAWQKLGEHHYKLYNLAVSMGQKIPPPTVIENHLNFLNSDHANFWYHNSTSHFPETLNAVLLTDTGPFRGQMKKCYHSKCDDLSVMSPEKLQFAKKTADALTATLVELTKATSTGNILNMNYELLVALIFICNILKSLNVF